MSTFKEKITAILATHKDLFSRHGIKLSTEESTPMKFEAQATDADGKVVYTTANAFEVNAEVFVLDADGNPQPAADGEYILDGVTKIVVASGIISEVEAVEAPEEDMSDVISQLADRLTALETKLTEADTALSTAQTELAAATKRATDAEAKVTQLSKTPVKGVKDEKPKAEPVPFKSGNKTADGILAGIQSMKSN